MSVYMSLLIGLNLLTCTHLQFTLESSKRTQNPWSVDESLKQGLMRHCSKFLNE